MPGELLTQTLIIMVLMVINGLMAASEAAILSQSLDRDALEAHCRLHIAGYKIPRVIHEVAEISRQPSGKPDYRWAKEILLTQS